MATYVLIPGAGGSAWYWHRLVAEDRLGITPDEMPGGHLVASADGRSWLSASGPTEPRRR